MDWNRILSHCVEEPDKRNKMKKGFRKISFSFFVAHFLTPTLFYYDFNAVHKWSLLSSVLQGMRGYYFSAELSAWTETDWLGGKLPRFSPGRGLHLLTPRLRQSQGALGHCLLTFHWFHNMLPGTRNWSLTNCFSSGLTEIRMQCGIKDSVTKKSLRYRITNSYINY